MFQPIIRTAVYLDRGQIAEAVADTARERHARQ
jgi:hypothetical protein